MFNVRVHWLVVVITTLALINAIGQEQIVIFDVTTRVVILMYAWPHIKDSFKAWVQPLPFVGKLFYN